MAIVRWLGTAALVSSLGCGGNANTPDGSAGGGDGSTPGDDAVTDSDANRGDAVSADGTPGDAGSADATLDVAPSSSDAKIGDAGLADAACVTGSVTFEIQVAPASGTGFCVPFSFPVSTSWVAVRPAGGEGTLDIVDPCPGRSVCGACYGCNGGGGLDLLGDGGAESTWDGTYYVGGPGNASQACAPPGDYIATFCAYAQAPDASSCGACAFAQWQTQDGSACGSTTVCTDTPFVWPPADGGAPVVGVLGP